MPSNTILLPFGTQFSPNVVSLRWLLMLAKRMDGCSIKQYSTEIAKQYWPDSRESLKMAGNTKISLTSYQLITDGEIHLTELGENLLSISDDDQMHKEFAKYILFKLNGLLLIDTIRQMYLNGDAMTTENVTLALIQRGA